MTSAYLSWPATKTCDAAQGKSGTSQSLGQAAIVSPASHSASPHVAVQSAAHDSAASARLGTQTPSPQNASGKGGEFGHNAASPPSPSAWGNHTCSTKCVSSNPWTPSQRRQHEPPGNGSGGAGTIARVSESYPFRFYDTYVDGDRELTYRLHFERDVDPAVLATWLAVAPGIPGEVHDRPASWSDAVAPTIDEPGRIEICVYGSWAIVHQNVFDPMEPGDPAMALFQNAFVRLHELASLREVCALHGTASGELYDPWTIWSFQRRPPDPAPAIDGADWATPYDDMSA
jgi:hypothetical protein